MGSDVSATVEFDGTFTKDEEEVEAVISDGKIEFQKWWDASEKQDDGDEVEVKLKKIEVVYKYEKSSSTLKGDVNDDGKVSVADIVMLGQWLLTKSDKLTNVKNADIYEDNRIDVYDMILLRKLLLESKDLASQGTL